MGEKADSTEGGETTSPGKDSSEFSFNVPGFIKVFLHVPVSVCRIPFFPNQCPHFNSRHPERL